MELDNIIGGKSSAKRSGRVAKNFQRKVNKFAGVKKNKGSLTGQQIQQQVSDRQRTANKNASKGIKKLTSRTVRTAIPVGEPRTIKETKRPVKPKPTFRQPNVSKGSLKPIQKAGVPVGEPRTIKETKRPPKTKPTFRPSNAAHNSANVESKGALKPTKPNAVRPSITTFSPDQTGKPTSKAASKTGGFKANPANTVDAKVVKEKQTSKARTGKAPTSKTPTAKTPTSRTLNPYKLAKRGVGYAIDAAAGGGRALYGAGKAVGKSLLGGVAGQALVANEIAKAVDGHGELANGEYIGSVDDPNRGKGYQGMDAEALSKLPKDVQDSLVGRQAEMLSEYKARNNLVPKVVDTNVMSMNQPIGSLDGGKNTLPTVEPKDSEGIAPTPYESRMDSVVTPNTYENRIDSVVTPDAYEAGQPRMLRQKNMPLSQGGNMEGQIATTPTSGGKLTSEISDGNGGYGELSTDLPFDSKLGRKLTQEDVDARHARGLTAMGGQVSTYGGTVGVRQPDGSVKQVAQSVVAQQRREAYLNDVRKNRDENQLRALASNIANARNGFERKNAVAAFNAAQGVYDSTHDSGNGASVLDSQRALTEQAKRNKLIAETDALKQKANSEYNESPIFKQLSKDLFSTDVEIADRAKDNLFRTLNFGEGWNVDNNESLMNDIMAVLLDKQIPDKKGAMDILIEEYRREEADKGKDNG